VTHKQTKPPARGQQGKPSRQRREAREHKRAGFAAAVLALLSAVSAAVLAADDALMFDTFGLAGLTDSQAAASGAGIDAW
jgi:hypothetical protein